MAPCNELKTQPDIEALPGCRTLRWYDNPLQPGKRFRSRKQLRDWDGTNVYRLPEDQNIGVDVDEVEVTIRTCTRDDMDVNFSEGASVLKCKADDPLVNIVHLQFNPPVKAVGASVTGNWKDGREYMVALTLVLKDGSKCTPFATAPTGKFSSQRGTAPFVGAEATDGNNPIAEMYCDIYLADQLIDDQADVLISDLYFVPNNTSNP
ncbi:MAG: hypothetical protein AB7G68_11925 [Nitrospiraceae bacterium]